MYIKTLLLIIIALSFKISVYAKEIPSPSNKLLKESKESALNGIKEAIFEDIPDDVNDEERSHLDGILKGLWVSDHHLFKDWVPGSQSLNRSNLTWAYFNYKKICTQRYPNRNDVPSKGCQKKMGLVIDKIFFGNYGNDLEDSSIPIYEFPKKSTTETDALATDKAAIKCPAPEKPKTRGRRGPAVSKGAPLPTLASGQEFGPDGIPRNIVKHVQTPKPNKANNQQSSNQEQSLKGQPANGCVNFSMSNVINFSNSCDKNVMIQFAKFCHISDPHSGTAGKTEVRAIYFYPNQSKSMQEIDLFGGFCQTLAGNTAQFSIKSQNYL